MRSIGIFAAPGKPSAKELARQLVALAEAHGISVRVQMGCAQEIGRLELACQANEDVAACDVLVTLSGDGGVLGAARAAAPHNTPILAVDLGRLGFLSTVRPTELERAFYMLLHNEFVVEERMMLDARVLRPGKSPEPKVLSPEPDRSLSTQHSALSTDLADIGGSIGLNDAVVAKSALARILRLSIHIEGELVAETRSDGLIISTPTGSTAYALSAGGPIVHPGVPLLLICPICAHSLTQRPLVADPDDTIEIHAEWESDEVAASEIQAMLTVDGQIGVRLQSGDIVQVRRSEHIARLLHLPDYSFYGRLRQKMGWRG